MFFLFFGTKTGKTITQKLHHSTCPYCGQRDTLTATRTPNYFHLFWISLFKVGTSEFIECSHCKKGYYKDEFSEDMKQEMERLK